jgi:Tfp pilus assembly protein PilP
MGQDFGEVVQIAPDHVLLREWHANALGQWQLQSTRFPDKGQP